MNPESPIFTRTYDYLAWTLVHTGNFPKSERFRLAKRLEDGAFSFYELLVKAAKSSTPRSALLEADQKLQMQRLLWRLCHKNKLASNEQYHFVAAELKEIGNLLGSWLKSLPTH